MDVISFCYCDIASFLLSFFECLLLVGCGLCVTYSSLFIILQYWRCSKVFQELAPQSNGLMLSRNGTDAITGTSHHSSKLSRIRGNHSRRATKQSSLQLFSCCCCCCIKTIIHLVAYFVSRSFSFNCFHRRRGCTLLPFKNYFSRWKS